MSTDHPLEPNDELTVQDADSEGVLMEPGWVERLRFSGERSAAAAVRADVWLRDLVAAAEGRGAPDVERVRRQLLARSLLLTEGMAADAWRAARTAATALGVSAPLELYQSAGAENAGIHLVAEPVLLEIRGRLLSLLDTEATVAVFGHELGHWLAHGPESPDAALGLVVWAALEQRGVPEHARDTVSRFSMAREITADRMGLLATRDLEAALRLEMATTTGLSTTELSWDTEAYLEQCKTLVGSLEAGGHEVVGSTHPEHGLRAWALWLWSETDTYQQLTGEGPGTRSAAEVDAAIERVLGTGTAKGLTESTLVLDPIPEVHECALASAVLVALADNELADEEVAAIERVFASRVDDWQRYLNWDNALEAFSDTAAVIIQGGASQQRSVFQVLVHVLAADGKVSQSEVDMIISVGDALRCGTMYRALLTPVLRTLGVEDVDPAHTEVKPIPMPARADEAEAALRTFLRGIVRRNGGEVSPRRLFVLLGVADGSDKAQDTLMRLFSEVGIESEPPLEGAPLDRLLTLSPTESARARLAVQAPTPTATDLDEPARLRLSSALSRLRDQLVSGDGRSPSIRLRRCRKARSLDLHRLEALSVGHAARVLALIQGGAVARLVDGREAGVHDGADAVSGELLALYREDVARSEQTGARDLYVGAPFLTGVFRGYLVRAPLILHPVELERQRGRGFKLRPRDDTGAVANQALVRLLFSKRNTPFPDALGDELDAAAAQGIDAVRSLLADHGITARAEQDTWGAFSPRDEAFATWPSGRVVIENVAVLGFFPQSSSDMIQDFNALLAAVADEQEDLAARFGAAAALLPADIRAAIGVEDTPPPASSALVPVLSADPSQLAVLHEARQRRLLVVDGPPGTGKSQVIVNLVADALAQGQSVAVVCEKRAALDVVAQRLEQVGLRHLLAVVHDVHLDRRDLYNQVLARLGDGHLRDHDAAAAERIDADLAELTDALRQRREALATALSEHTPTLGQLHLIAASCTAPALTGLDPTVARLSLDDARRLAGRLAREALHADLHVEGSPWRPPAEGPPRPTLAHASAETLSEVEAALDHARRTAQAFDAVRAQVPSPEATLAAQDALQQATSWLADHPNTASRRRLCALLARFDEPAIDALVAAAVQAFADHDAWTEHCPERATFEGSPELTQALTVARKRGDSFLRFFSLAWWRARSLLRSVLGHQWAAAAHARVDSALATRVEARQQGAGAWAALDKLLAALQLSPVLPDSPSAAAWVAALADDHAHARTLIAHRAALVAAGAWPQPTDTDLSAWEASLQAQDAVLEAATAHKQALSPVRAWLPWLDPLADRTAVEALYEAWAMDAPRVVSSDRNLDAAASLHGSARQMVWALASQLPDGSDADWEEAVQHGHAVACLAATERRHPRTKVLDRPTPLGELADAEARLAELVARRAELVVSQTLAARDRVPLLTEARPEHGARRTPLQKAREQMLREASKRRYVLSLRGFVRQFAKHGLMEILPVWLVSPETMAVLFEGRPVFDLVVMDEASQATVEKGLPALVRGRRAVVAGDERQMPPSRFFELRGPDEDEPGTAETVEADALTAESLLVLARERCPHAGLRWHYRCHHEELIAFSNHAMYGGGLFTIPSTATPSAVPALRWISVEDGQYHRGSNPVEAARVVDEIAALIDVPDGVSPPSIGVVTFNLQQRRVVLDTIDQRTETDPAFAERWAVAVAHEELDQRPFVKNLESVQGDERDVILFSLGHAPVERQSGPLKGERYVPARFGPIGQAGGERRLNVAVSRAKQQCVVVASFSPKMLTVAGSKHAGPKLLKAFLEFVWDLTHSRHRQAEKTLDRVRSGSLGAVRRTRRADLRVPSLGAQVGLALEDAGVGFDLDVGTSGFRVPLALRHPEDPTRWTVAVLTEEGHEAGDVDEAHRHAPGVLRARGWVVERVSAREWHRDPDAVVARLMAAYEAASEE